MFTSRAFTFREKQILQTTENFPRGSQKKLGLVAFGHKFAVNTKFVLLGF